MNCDIFFELFINCSNLHEHLYMLANKTLCVKWRIYWHFFVKSHTYAYGLILYD